MARRRKKKNPSEGLPPRRPNGKLLRPMQPERPTSFQKLRACECFPEVHDRVVRGYSPAEVARYVQEERGEYTDAAHSSLKTIIERYRRSLPPGVLAERALSVDHKAAIVEVDEAIDEVRELTKLYRIQMDRIEQENKIEKSVGKLLPTMTQEMRVAGEILNRIAQLKMDLGLNERHLGTVDVDVDARYDGTEVGKVLQDPRKRRRVLNIAEHAMALAERGIEIAKTEDGELELVPGEEESSPKTPEDLH